VRVVNVGKLLTSGNVEDLSIYEFPDGLSLSVMTQAKSGRFVKGKLDMQGVVETRLDPNIKSVLADAKVTGKPAATVTHLPQQTIDTTLSSERLIARILTPEKMSLVALYDYIDYLDRNQLQADRQIVAVWRKMAYPFTLLVMLTIAAPISFMQTRRGGVGAKVFLGILLGTGFFMINQLALNVSLLFRWPPVVTALLPNIGAMILALTAVFMMENRNALAQRNGRFFFWKKSNL
jgi:lipopolysaccharide export system permease protein